MNNTYCLQANGQSPICCLLSKFYPLVLVTSPLEEIPHIILVVSVHNDYEALLQEIFPVLVPLPVPVEVGLITNLSSHDLLSEDITDRILKLTRNLSSLLFAVETQWNERRVNGLISDMKWMIEKRAQVLIF